MCNVKKCFANNSDDRRIVDVQLLSRASVKRKSRTRPTKNHFANLTPLRFLRYFNNDDSRFITSRILKRDMNVAVSFSFQSNYAARFRDINFGRWLRLLTRQEFDIKAVGWARVVAGWQSLISVYLIALWVLTYFGRPFD
jgi:hypothetical protein